MSFAVLVLLISVAVLYFFVFSKNKKEKQPEVADIPVSSLSKQSDSFNLSVENMLNAYYAMSESFVNWDTAAVKKNATLFKSALEDLKIDEFKADSVNIETVTRSINAIKSETEAITEDNILQEQRGSLNVLSQALFGLLNNIKYDRAQIYYQECPMAFDDVNSGNWLSAQKEIRNPYLGISHPKYKSGMLKCGSTKEIINFTSK